MAAEESALAASFLLAEPAPGPGQESGQEDEDPASRCIRAVLAGAPPPGSPERLQLLHLEAAPVSAGERRAPHSGVSPPWEHQPLSPTTPLSAAVQAAAQSPPQEGDAAPAAPALMLQGSAAVVPTRAAAGRAGGSASASASAPASGSVTLRVVRSDEQEALHAAMADLEKSAFLGLKALLGGALHHPASAASVAAASAASSRGLAVMAHSTHEARCSSSAALHMFAPSRAEHDPSVAVLLVPSSGATSTSLWDVSDAEVLKSWLDEAINVDVEHTVYEVQEEFSIGLGEVVTEGTKDVAQKTGRALGAAASTVGQQAIELDHKLRISERATAASTAFKESAVGRNASAAFGRLGTAMGAGTKKVMENEKVNAATGAVGTSFKKLGASISSLTGGRRGSMGSLDGTAPEHSPQFVQDQVGDYSPPSRNDAPYAPYSAPEPVAVAGPGASAKGPAAPPTGAPAARSAAPPPAQQSANSGAPAFTLDDAEPESKH
ncbi:hypothetical protein ACK3TF_000428 [Chlorella vulgaris]